jgi:Mg2+ and Co2+ transporter CorA
LALASFFESRNTKFPDETNLEIAEMLRRLGERVEAFRMPLLEKGDKSELLKIADASGQAMKVIEVLWKKEDADG